MILQCGDSEADGGLLYCACAFSLNQINTLQLTNIHTILDIMHVVTVDRTKVKAKVKQSTYSALVVYKPKRLGMDHTV